MEKQYEDRNLTYTDDGRLLDENGFAIMMDWEDPIMKKSAEIICQNGGRVLNVGFGMGIIDSYIEEYDIEEHWIIESHPDVYQKMFDDGWHLKPHVKILLGDWRWYLPYLPKFDGIYIDTWDEEFFEFHEYLPNILKEDGIYSFFNNVSHNRENKDLLIRETDYEYLKDICKIEIEHISLEKVDSKDLQTPNGLHYWPEENNFFYCPKITLKK